MKIEELSGIYYVINVYQNKNWVSFNVAEINDRITGNTKISLERGVYLFEKGIPSFVSVEDAVNYNNSFIVKSYLLHNDLYNKEGIMIKEMVNSIIENIFAMGIRDVSIITTTVRNVLKNYKNENISKYLENKDSDLIMQQEIFKEKYIKFLFPKEVAVKLKRADLRAQAAIAEAYNDCVKNIKQMENIYFSKVVFYKKCLFYANQYNVTKVDIDNYFSKYGVFFNSYSEGIAINNYREIESDILKYFKGLRSFEVEEHTDGNLEDITLTEGQVSAVNSIVSAPRQSFQICSGGPGTGKTTSISHALDIAASKKETKGKYSVLCLAPTGAAKKVVEGMFANFNSCDVVTKTIHSYIYDKQLKGEEFDYVIVDEASMVDILLFKNLIDRAEISSSRVIFMGDPKQLPSIGFGAVLRDSINSKMVQHVHLTEVKRQAEGSNLLKFIQAFGAECENDFVQTQLDYLINLANESNDIHIHNNNFPNTDKELGECLKQANVLDDFENTQIIAPTNKTLKTVNDYVQSLRSKGKREVYKKGYRVFYEGDKVVFLKNTKTAVQNGTIGFIQSGNPSFIEVLLDDGETAFVSTEATKNDDLDEEEANSEQTTLSDTVYVDDMVLGYCVTVHKSQGGTWRNILYLQGTNGYNMVCNELLYTAFSRASENLSILCTTNTIQKGLITRVLNTRQTYLQSMIKKED